MNEMGVETLEVGDANRESDTSKASARALKGAAGWTFQFGYLYY